MYIFSGEFHENFSRENISGFLWEKFYVDFSRENFSNFEECHILVYS